jgi:hypothetical protein
MHLTLRASGSSGWLPASILAAATAAVLVHYDTPIVDVALFAAYVVLGLALPGMLWVRLLRGRGAHISEDAALGLALGYCLEIATYIPARAVGAPLLVLVWPIVTLVAFAALPALRRHWRGSGERAPAWWSWSLAAMLGYLLVYAAGTYFAQHHLVGTDTPYVDMPYHLALLAELRYHVPPDIPYVAGVPLAYHWFFYADAAAASWVTGIEPVTLLYRLSGLPMFMTFVVLTAAAARRLTGGWWTGPAAVAIALFGAVAGPYGWIPDSVPDTQILGTTWTSPTNLFGLALFAAVILAVLDLLTTEGPVPRRRWLLVGLLIFGVAGAKATELPLLMLGLVTVLFGTAITGRRLHRSAAIGLILTTVGFALATILLFRGASLGLSIGLGAPQTFPLTLSIGARNAGGIHQLWAPIVALGVAAVMWSFLWAGAFGLLARWRKSVADPSILLLVGICAAALGAVSVFLYPGLSQYYFLRGAAGAFGLLAAAGIAAMVDRIPAESRSRSLIVAGAVALVAGAALVIAIEALGRANAPKLGATRLAGVALAVVLPVMLLVAAAVAGYVVARVAARRSVPLHGAVPLVVVALVMGFGAPRTVAVASAPFTAGTYLDDVVPGDGITAARWLRDHSAPSDLVATNMHCRPVEKTPGVCDARHFWVAAYTERHVLVEGWAYTTEANIRAVELGVSDRTVPFWDPAMLAANDAAFTNPTAATLATLRDRYGVHWLLADLTKADAVGLAAHADLRDLEGDFAIYELRQP